MSPKNISYEDLTKIVFQLSSNIIKYAIYFCKGLKFWIKEVDYRGIELFVVRTKAMIRCSVTVQQILVFVSWTREVSHDVAQMYNLEMNTQKMAVYHQ